jgi:hypothetical protein
MVAPGRPPNPSPQSEMDADISLAGWDPYIVAITGGGGTGYDASVDPPKPATESRESRLMAWLREHGA